MKKNYSFFFLFLINLSVAQADEIVSPYRPLNVDYTFYFKPQDKLLGSSALSRARYFDEQSLPQATRWINMEQLKSRFEAIRDERMLSWRNHSGSQRKLTWFYPDDGCYARAAMVMRHVFRSYAPMAKKVFVFGNLRVRTNNSPRGVVGWWYHVAPIVEVDGIKYVLDPSIEFSRALSLTDWLARMGNPSKMKVAICSSGTYLPGSNCDIESDGIETRAEKAEQYFLNREWSRMVQMGRDSEL